MKRYFLTPAIMLCIGLVAAMLKPAFAGNIGAIGAAIASSTLPIVLALIMVGRRARWSGNPVWAWLMGIAGLGLSVYAWVALDGLSAHVLVAIAGLATFIAYSSWYARLDRWAGKVRVGELLRAFTVYDDSGNPISSDALAGSITLMLFYRGNWCPLCMAQIREVAASYRELATMGVRVVMISPQPGEKSRALAKRFDVPMTFYEDRDGAAARRLGIEHPGGLPLGLQALGYDSDTVMPTLIVTDADSVVRYLDETDDYRVRPEPTSFIGLIRNQLLDTP